EFIGNDPPLRICAAHPFRFRSRFRHHTTSLRVVLVLGAPPFINANVLFVPQYLGNPVCRPTPNGVSPGRLGRWNSVCSELSRDPVQTPSVRIQLKNLAYDFCSFRDDFQVNTDNAITLACGIGHSRELVAVASATGAVAVEYAAFKPAPD